MPGGASRDAVLSAKLFALLRKLAGVAGRLARRSRCAQRAPDAGSEGCACALTRDGQLMVKGTTSDMALSAPVEVTDLIAKYQVPGVRLRA